MRICENIFKVQIMKKRRASIQSMKATLTPHAYQITTPSSPKPQIVASWFSREAKNVRFSSRSESILNLPRPQHPAKINQVSMFTRNTEKFEILKISIIYSLGTRCSAAKKSHWKYLAMQKTSANAIGPRLNQGHSKNGLNTWFAHKAT